MEKEKLVSILIKTAVVLVIIGATVMIYRAKQASYAKEQQKIEMQMKALRKSK
ncbi:MAG: hypothetical protein ABII68_06450 [Pseudomonadota bacterium]